MRSPNGQGGALDVSLHQDWAVHRPGRPRRLADMIAGLAIQTQWWRR
jgi:hypothetical protein